MDNNGVEGGGKTPGNNKYFLQIPTYRFHIMRHQSLDYEITLLVINYINKYILFDSGHNIGPRLAMKQINTIYSTQHN